MSDQLSLLRQIVTNPDDDTARLVYADWLDEFTDEYARAEFIRTQIALHALERSAECPRCRLTLSPLKKDRFPLLAGCVYCGKVYGFWRDLKERAEKKPALLAREKELYQHGMNTDCLNIANADVFFGKRKLGEFPTYNECRLDHYPGFHFCANEGAIWLRVVRGFVSAIRTSYEAFARDADRLIWYEGSEQDSRPCSNCSITTAPRTDDHPEGEDQTAYRTMQFTLKVRPCPVCKGEGRIFRTFKPTMQPIRHVMLTSVPELRYEFGGGDIARFAHLPGRADKKVAVYFSSVPERGSAREVTVAKSVLEAVYHGKKTPSPFIRFWFTPSPHHAGDWPTFDPNE